MAILDLNDQPAQEWDFPIVGRLPEPTPGESAVAGVQQGSLKVLGQVGAAARNIGDIFGAPSLAQWGRDLNLNAKQAAEELTPLGESNVQEILRSATLNTISSLPAFMTGRLIPMLTTMGGQSYLDSYAEGKEGGLSTGRAMIYGGVDAIFETATEAWSLPILFKTNIGLIRRTQEFLMREMAGEEITTIGQSMNKWLTLNPEMTVKEYWETLKQEMAQTALVTPPTAIMQMGVARGLHFLRRTSKGIPLQVEGEIPSPNGSLPVPNEPTIPPPAVPPIAGQQMPLPGVPEPTKQDYMGYTPPPVETPDIGKLVRDNTTTDPRQLPLPLPPEQENTMHTPEENPTETPAPVIEPIVVKKDDADLADAVLVPEIGEEKPADVVTVMPQAPDPVRVTNDYRDHTPEELAAMAEPDLRLYQGIWAKDQSGLSVVAWDPDFENVEPAGPPESPWSQTVTTKGAWKIGFTKNVSKTHTEEEAAQSGQFSHFADYAIARSFLEMRTGMKLSEEDIKGQHYILSLRDAVARDGAVSAKQLEVYGERLGRIADKAKLVRGKYGYSQNLLPQDWGSSLRSPDLPVGVGVAVPVWKDTPTGPVETELPAMPNGTYSSSQSMMTPGLEKIVRFVEMWRQKYKLDVPISIKMDSNQRKNNGSVGMYAADSQGVSQKNYYEIILSPNTLLSDNVIIAAHEFGHILGFETLKKAPPQVTMELVEAWLDAFTATPEALNLSTGDLVNAGGGVVRARVAQLFNKDVDTRPSNWRYSIQFNEYIADQVAQHLYENNFYSPHSKSAQAILRQLGQKLLDFFQTSVQKFAPKTPFKKFLDDMAGAKAEPVLAAKPKGKTFIEKTKGGSTVKHGEFKVPDQLKTANPWDPLGGKPAAPAKAPADKFDPEVVKERAHLISLLKKHGMWDDSIRDEVDPTRSADMFNFDRAKDILDAMGVEWENNLSLDSGVNVEAERRAQNDPQRGVFNIGDEVLMQNPARAMEKKGNAPTGRVIAVQRDAHPVKGDLITIQDDSGNVAQHFSRYVRFAEDWRNRYATISGPRSNAVQFVDEPDTWQFRNRLSTAIPKLAAGDTFLQRKLADSAISVRNFGRMWRGTLTALQIRKLYGDKIPGVKAFVDGLQAMSAYANKVRKRAEDGLTLMGQVGENQRNKVFELMIKETETGKFLNTPDDFMKAGLNENGIKLYNTLREDYRYALTVYHNLAHKSLLEEMGITMDAAGKPVNSEDGMPLSEEKAKRLGIEQKKINEAFAGMMAKPYYPHSRFGDYYAVAKMDDGKTLAFTQGETLEQVRKYANAISGDGITAWYGEMPEAVKPFMNMPYHVFEMMKRQLNLTPKQMDEFENILKNLSPEQSFIRKFKTRKNIEGWENNPEQGPQVYADYFSKFANYAARRWHSALLDNAIKATKQFKRDIVDPGYATSMVLIDRLTNWMAETKEYASSPDVATANVRAAVTLWYLGAVPKSAVVNAASVPLMTLPWLGKRYGDIKAAAALAQAYRDVGKMFMRPEALSLDERQFLEWLEEMGVADQSYASTMAAVREGGKLLELTMLGKGSMKAHAYNAKWFAMWGFHKVEVMNRLVSGMAAYRLAKKELGHTGDNMSQAAAEIAKDCVQDTQNENQQWNRPELMRGKKSLLTLFMSYTQNAMFQMYGGDKSWQRMLALQLMIAGLLGLPLAKNLDDLIQWFVKEAFGTKASAETALRDFLKGTFINPDWVLKGASYNFLNTGVNLQSSLSMGNLIPGIDALVLEGSFPERLTNAASDVGGAGAAVVINFMQAMADDNPDSLKAWSRAMPTVAKNAYEGYKMITKGTVADAAGDPILDVTGLEGSAKLLGFQATSVTKEREKRFAQKQMVQYWLTRRKMVFDQFELAEQSGDLAAENQAEKSLDEFNDEVPDPAMAIRRRDLQNAMRKRAKNADKKLEGEPLSKRQAGIYEQVGGRY